MGIGVGCIGLSYDEFCALEYDEFDHICKAWQEMRDGLNRERWEQTRLLAAISIQPYSKKKISPRQLIPLPWDDKAEQEDSGMDLTPEERKERFKNLIKRV